MVHCMAKATLEALALAELEEEPASLVLFAKDALAWSGKPDDQVHLQPIGTKREEILKDGMVNAISDYTCSVTSLVVQGSDFLRKNVFGDQEHMLRILRCIDPNYLIFPPGNHRSIEDGSLNPPLVHLNNPTEDGLLKYRDVPVDESRGSPIYAWGESNRWRLGTTWSEVVQVPLEELSSLKEVVQDKKRLDSILGCIRDGKEEVLPPVEIGVFQNGSAWIVDGNHRLRAYRKLKRQTIPATFTFVGK